jgi:myosin heavy subunit
LDAIAAAMVEKKPAAPTEETAAEEVIESATPDDDAGQGSEEELFTRPDEGADTDEGDTADDPDLSDTGDEPEGEILDIEGDPLVSVMQDGEEQLVPLSELRAKWSGEGEIAKRLQQATEARNEAQQAREIALAEQRDAAKEVIATEVAQLRQQTQQLAKVYQHYGDALVQPQVAKPEPAMREEDPIGYFSAMEAYREDQQRLTAQKAHMQEVVQQAEALQTQARTEHMRQQMEQMIQEVPAMADTTYRQQQVQNMYEIGKAVGFTEEEITANATDRRLVYLAMLAHVGAEVFIKQANGGLEEVKQKVSAPPPPKARAGRAAQRNKQRKAVTNRARSTGSVDDVAQTLIVPGR